MSNAMLHAHIDALPADLKLEVENFITRLEQKHMNKNKSKEREFGGLKGMFIVSPDFDEPLDDFKDYM